MKAVVPSGNGIADKKISGQNDVYTINDLKYGVIYEVEETSVPTGYMEAAPWLPLYNFVNSNAPSIFKVLVTLKTWSTAFSVLLLKSAANADGCCHVQF